MHQPLDRAKLKELHDKGLKVSDIAKEMGCSLQAVYKQLKLLGLEVVKQACPVAPAIVEKQTTATEQLMYLVGQMRKELDWLEKEIPATATPEYRLWQDQRVKFSGEIRKLISTLGDIAYKLFQANEVAEALKIIEEEIAVESLECQQRIHARLERRRHIRFPALTD